MTMSNQIRILKADDVARHAIVTLPRAEAPDGPRVDPPPRIDAGSRDPDVEVLVERARAEGAADAARVLEPSLRQLAAALSGLAEESAAARYAALRADSDVIVDTALQVCRWILDRELSQPDAVMELAQRALAETGQTVATRLRVHPDLAVALEASAPDAITVVADGSLAPGEFVTETAGPDVAFRFEHAIERARDELRERGEAS